MEHKRNEARNFTFGSGSCIVVGPSDGYMS